jgi:hypothetical protein
MSLPSPLSLLLVGAMIAAALLTASLLRLFRLPDTATVGVVCRLTDLAHVVAILDHVLAAEAASVVSIVCHNKLLLTSLSCVSEQESTETISVRCQRVQ